MYSSYPLSSVLRLCRFLRLPMPPPFPPPSPPSQAHLQLVQEYLLHLRLCPTCGSRITNPHRASGYTDARYAGTYWEEVRSLLLDIVLLSTYMPESAFEAAPLVHTVYSARICLTKSRPPRYRRCPVRARRARPPPRVKMRIKTVHFLYARVAVMTWPPPAMILCVVV